MSTYPSKICQPILANVLFRERLFLQLDTLRKQNVIWVSGPGGAGKTTLLNSYAKSRSLACLWYQLDSSDQDLATFFYYLGLAGKKATALENVEYPVFTPEFLLGIKEFSRNFFSILYNHLEPNSLLVFDNCQDVGEDTELFNTILAAISRMPQGMNIVLISRNEPISAFSRLKANRRMSFLNWNDLRLTRKEFTEIAKGQGLTYKQDQLNDLHELIDGWAAGLTLMAAPYDPDHYIKSSTSQLRTQSKHNIFDYYAEEVFNQLDSGSREFLVRSSLLPYLDENLLEIVSNNSLAFELLNRLYRSNIYITQLSNSPLIYQYHQLFKEFLRDRCTRMLSAEEINQLLTSAAHKLISKAQVIEAAQLLIEAEDWKSLGDLLNTQAQNLFHKGQFQTLARWLQHIPESLINEQPWLLYWSGMCLMMHNPEAGRKYFEKSLAGFEEKKDVIGIYLAASGLGECIGYRFNSFIRYDQWIEKLNELHAAYPEFPSKEIEARVTISMLNGLSLRSPSHSGLQLWRQLAYSLLKGGKNELQISLKIQLLIPLIMNRLFSGDLIEANQLITHYRSLAKEKNMPTLALLTLKNFEGYYHWQNGNPSECCKAVNDALDLANESGIHVLSFLLLLNGASGALSGTDLTLADEYLNKVEPALVKTGAYVTLLFHLNKTWKYLLANDSAQAVFYAERAQHFADEAGNPESTAFARFGYALALHAASREDEAAIQLDLGRTISAESGARQATFACLLTKAEFALHNGDKKAACDYLREGLALGRENAYRNFYGWRPRAVSKLCQLALQEGIETGYVQELIQIRGLMPSTPPIFLQHWPWALRIFTLGRFEILRDGTPLRSSGKSQQKPLALLKALISFGSVGVPQFQLEESLWPDSDGDMQRQIFNTTLHRLRKLLGVKDLLFLSGGELTLNNELCWVDVWSFERHVDQIEKAATNSTVNVQCIESAERITELYQGAFLPAELEAWAISSREKLHNKMVQTLLRLGQYYFQNANWERAIEWYRKGINIDPHTEIFYHKIMLCYLSQERKAEAVQIYSQCKTVLKAAMGITPSQSMQKLYEEIRGTKD